ncbi:ROK family protein [Cesiribacter andamanensis]|uniref:Glucokinase n=1 Tax=Cesiribacter andamanensis AMV16 TaxID=1279009 RepID=M7N4N6_9BACT|nr:ROK family protein [Cesiribacter andamanensis]EMR02191.1 Glucokinase [Cesiribacter andamanensis AMV16]
MRKYLGIDVGGTNVKCGIITETGEILHQIKYPTLALRQSGNIVGEFLQIVQGLLKQNPDILQVGIGLPGTLNKARTHTIELPNIPELDHCPLLSHLQQAFPDKVFLLENDANAAALGEMYFSGQPMPEDFIFVTLGTGIGGAAIIDGFIFKGGDGNSMEIGHMMSEGGRRLEEIIGKNGLLDMAKEGVKRVGAQSVLANMDPINTKAVLEAAGLNDPLALQIFEKMGYLLGEAFVSMIRVLDIKNVYIGGGISATFDYLYPSLMLAMERNLTPYYLKDLVVKPALLGNHAGILGAASLCISHLALQERALRTN